MIDLSSFTRDDWNLLVNTTCMDATPSSVMENQIVDNLRGYVLEDELHPIEALEYMLTYIGILRKEYKEPFLQSSTSLWEPLMNKAPLIDDFRKGLTTNIWIKSLPDPDGSRKIMQSEIDKIFELDIAYFLNLDYSLGCKDLTYTPPCYNRTKKELLNFEEDMKEVFNVNEYFKIVSTMGENVISIGEYIANSIYLDFEIYNATDLSPLVTIFNKPTIKELHESFYECTNVRLKDISIDYLNLVYK